MPDCQMAAQQAAGFMFDSSVIQSACWVRHVMTTATVPLFLVFSVTVVSQEKSNVSNRRQKKTSGITLTWKMKTLQPCRWLLPHI